MLEIYEPIIGLNLLEGLRSGAILRVLHLVQLLSMVEIDSCNMQLSISTID